MNTALQLNGRFWSKVENDGENAYEFRLPLILALLRKYQPDILGFQEFMAWTKQELSPALPGYGWHLGRLLNRNAHTPIAWNKKKFTLVRRGSFWLNAPPHREGILLDAGGPRCAAWVLLREKKTGKLLVVLNTHFDERGELARQRSAEIILEQLALNGLNKYPMLIMGDFNCSPYQPIPDVPFTARAYEIFAGAALLDAFLSFHGAWPPPNTFHDYLQEDYRPDQYGTWYIDWPMFRALKILGVLHLRSAGKPVSDHYPIFLLFDFASLDSAIYTEVI